MVADEPDSEKRPDHGADDAEQRFLGDRADVLSEG